MQMSPPLHHPFFLLTAPVTCRFFPHSLLQSHADSSHTHCSNHMQILPPLTAPVTCRFFPHSLLQILPPLTAPDSSLTHCSRFFPHSLLQILPPLTAPDSSPTHCSRFFPHSLLQILPPLTAPVTCRFFPHSLLQILPPLTAPDSSPTHCSSHMQILPPFFLLIALVTCTLFSSLLQSHADSPLHGCTLLHRYLPSTRSPPPHCSCHVQMSPSPSMTTPYCIQISPLSTTTPLFLLTLQPQHQSTGNTWASTK